MCGKNYATNAPNLEAIALIDFAKQSGSSVLVHCYAGISRSVTICLAYLMHSLHASLDEAFDLLLKRSGTIAPNFHFMETLLGWERQLMVSGCEAEEGDKGSPGEKL